MHLFKKLLGKSSALAEFQKLNQQIDSFDKFIVPVHEALQSRTLAQEQAKALFFQQPTGDNLIAWEAAHSRVFGAKSATSFDRSFTPLEILRGEVDAFVKQSQQGLKNAPASLHLYCRCLAEITEGLRQAIDMKRRDISAKLAEIETEFDANQVSPLPLWNSRLAQLESQAALLRRKIDHPRVLVHDGLIDEVRASIVAGHLTDPAPATFVPRLQQGYPAGTTLEQAGLPPEPAPVAPASLTIPLSLIPLQPDIHTVNLEAARARQAREHAEHLAKQQETAGV